LNKHTDEPYFRLAYELLLAISGHK